MSAPAPERPPPRMGMREDVETYTEVLRRLTREEMLVAGPEREALGFAASGIAMFLRRRPWIDDAVRREGWALAARIEEVGRMFLASPFPIGHA